MRRQRTFYTFEAAIPVEGRKNRKRLRVEISETNLQRARRHARHHFASKCGYHRDQIPGQWMKLVSTREACRLTVARGTYAHGTHAKYVLEKCRCARCVYANRRYEEQRAKDLAAGLTRTVDAGPVREHVIKLQSQGMGLKRIAKAAGVGGGVMTGLLYGRRERGTPPCRRIRRTTAEKLLSVKVAPQSPYQVMRGASVLAAWSMIADILELGWPKSWIARHVIGPKARALQLNMEGMEARHIAAIAALWRVTRPREASNHNEAAAITRAINQSRVVREQVQVRHTELKQQTRKLSAHCRLREARRTERVAPTETRAAS